ncbi:MAG: HAD-IA family hydrolase [Gammaproteobacteria bacterium]|nr:HAD-IA family hydrolase [Gammaproteobacteria bacterium]
MLKLIVFDWDGTIVDSFSKIFACKQVLAKKYNLTAPSEAIARKVQGMGFDKAMSLCFPSIDNETSAKIKQDFHETMQLKEYQAQLFDGIKEVLADLKASNIKLAIATSKARVELDKAIDFLGLTGIFDLICCGEEYKNKPDPAMLNHIMKKLGVTSEESLMLGDTITDIEFANNANMRIICLTFGAHTKETLQIKKPYAFIDNWKSLCHVLCTLNT